MKFTLAKVLAWSCSVFNSLPASGNFCHLLFDTQMVLKKSSIQIVKYGSIIKCERIINFKAILENPKADKIHFFRRYM